MGALKTKILTYSPEQYYPNDSAYANTTLANSGSGTTGTWNKTGGTPTLNATGGPDGSGCWQFSTDPATETSLRIFGSTTSGFPYSAQMDGDYSSGFWFRVPNLISGSTETTIDLGRVGGAAASAALTIALTGIDIGKIKSTAVPTTLTSTTRYDDGAWHYYAERMYSDGTNYIRERYIDGSLWNSGTVTNAGSIAYLQMADNSITATTGTITYIEVAHLYAAPSSSINGTAISQIWSAGTSINKTITETPATATALQTEPTIAVTAGNHTEVTTSITASAEFPSNIVALGQKNINNIITDILTASIQLADAIDVATGFDISHTADLMTASALLVEPILPIPAMTASATMPGGTASVTPNYYSLVKSLNPYLYIHNGATTPVNHGYQTGTFVRGGDLISNVASPAPLDMVAEGKSWKGTSGYNSNNYFTFTTSSATNSFESLTSQGDYAYEVWVNPLELPPNVYANTPITYAILNESALQISLNQSNINTGTNANRSYINLRIQNSASTFSNLTYFIDQTPISINNWSHIVVNVYQSGINANQRLVQLWIDGSVYINQTITFTPWTSTQTTDYVMGSNASSSTLSAPFIFDEVAIYDSPLTNSNIINHYNFIDTLSPNYIHFASPLTASSQSGDHNYLVTSNSNIVATPITASSLIVNPTVVAVKNINYQSDTLTASAQNTNVTVYWGWTIYATPATAYAEKPATYFLNDIYYQYVQSNFAPYRYVTFDSANAELDYGTDTDYSVAPTTIGGTIVNPDLGINGKSAKTTGTSYITDGVILNESEWNDDWGTANNDYVSSFWFQRAVDDQSTTGLRVLWNLNGHKDNQHVVVYHYQNKLHFQIDNQSGTHYTVTSANNVNIFDYLRHHIVIYSHFNNNHNYISIYVDGVSIIGAHDIGNYKVTTVNAASADSGANNEINNHPRLSIGCLITPFGSTALPVTPTNTKLIIDEIFWDKDAITQQQVTNLYAAMPDKTNKVIIVDPMTASDEFVMPAFVTSSVLSTIPLTASVEVVEPVVTADREVIYNATAYSVTAEFAAPKIFENKIITSDIFIATAIFNDAGVKITIPGGPFIANAKLANNYINGIIVTGNTFAYPVSMYNFNSPWASWLRATEVAGIYPTREVV
jgi:hypothetical protein